MAFTAEQLDRMRRLAGVRADADLATTVAALCEALDEAREELGDAEFAARVNRVVPAQPAAQSSADPVAWAVATGRISAERAATFWQAEAKAERRRTGSTAQLEATLRSLAPVYDTPEDSTSPWTTDPTTGRRVLASGRRPAASTSDTPHLDQLERDIYGPSVEENRRAEDLAAERELAEQLEQEQQRAAEDRPLTAAEERRIFGTEQG